MQSQERFPDPGVGVEGQGEDALKSGESAGCWAWVSDSGASPWQGRVYRFNVAAGRYTRWQVQTGAFNDPAPRVTGSESGTLLVADPARLELTAEQIASSNLLTGALEYSDVAGSPGRRVYATLDRDELQIHSGLPIDGPQSEPVHRRFACPE